MVNNIIIESYRIGTVAFLVYFLLVIGLPPGVVLGCLAECTFSGGRSGYGILEELIGPVILQRGCKIIAVTPLLSL